jgi:nucleotide-binding universal stress UspA family protein
MKLNHVLVPLDQSELSEAALPYAVEILADKGKLTLMTVVDADELIAQANFTGTATNVATGGIANVPADTAKAQSARKHAEQYLEQMRDKLHSAHYEIDIHLEHGSAAENILERAQASHVDVIVMSTHGRSGISRWLFGSVAQKVLSAARCPVFLIPQRATAPKKG